MLLALLASFQPQRLPSALTAWRADIRRVAFLIVRSAIRVVIQSRGSEAAFCVPEAAIVS